MTRRVGDAHAETRDKLDATVGALLRIRSIVENDADWPGDDIIAEVNTALEAVRPGSSNLPIRQSPIGGA